MTLSSLLLFSGQFLGEKKKKHLTNRNRRNLSHRAPKSTAQNLLVLTQRRILLTGRIDRLNTPSVNILAGFALVIHRSHPNALQHSSERAQYTAGSSISHVWESPNYIHPHSLQLHPTTTTSSTTATLCWLPSAAAKGYSLHTVLKEPPPDLRPPSWIGENIWASWHFSVSAAHFGFVKTAWSTISGGIGPAEGKKNALIRELCSLVQAKSQRTLVVFFSLFCKLFLQDIVKRGCFHVHMCHIHQLQQQIAS